MLTVIQPDGSCYREFCSKADSTFMRGDTADQANPFPVKLDATWKVSWTVNGTDLSTQFPLSKQAYDSVLARIPLDSMGKKDQRPFMVTIRKNYRSVEAMAKTFRLKPSHSWSRMKVDYTLTKKFGWFYTYYTYQETYPKTRLDVDYPIVNYMSKDEARFWFTGQPDLLKGMNGIEIRQFVGELEDKYNRWLTQNSWNAEYNVLLKHYEEIGNCPVSKEKLVSLKETIYEKEARNLDDIKMEKVLDAYFKTNAFSTFWKAKNSPMKRYEDELGNQDFANYSTQSFNYKLMMPGKVLSCENAVIKGDTLVWKLTSDRLVYDAYSLKAQSRRANAWAFILTGLVIVLAIGSLIYKPKQKKRRK